MVSDGAVDDHFRIVKISLSSTRILRSQAYRRSELLYALFGRWSRDHRKGMVCTLSSPGSSLYLCPGPALRLSLLRGICCWIS